MKNICNISIDFKKILVMLLLVVFLAACGNEKTIMVGGADCEENTAEEELVQSKDSKAKTVDTCIETNKQSCLGCKIFEIIYDAVGVNVMKVHSEMTGGSITLMMICFSLWLAKRLLVFVSSVTDQSIAQLWNEIFRQAFLCIFCGILASSPTMLMYAVNTFVYPIYVAFLKMGLEILENAITNSGQTATSFVVFGKTVVIESSGVGCNFNADNLINENGFPNELKEVIICMINVLKGHLVLGGKIAYTMMSQASHFTGAIAGLIVYGTFWIVRVSFVFYLVDTIFQLGIIILLLPMYIMFYAFKSTRKWCQSAFKTMLSSAGFLMCFSVIVALVLRGMIELVNNNKAIFNPDDGKKVFSDVGLGVLCLLLVGFLVYGSMKISQSVMKAMVDGKMSSDFQKNAKAMMQKGVGLIKSGLAALATASLSVMPEGVVKAVEKYKAAKGKFDRYTGGQIKK